MDSVSGSHVIQEVLGRLFWFLLGQSVAINPSKNIVDINHHKVVEFPVFSISPWAGVREVNGVLGYTGSRVGQERSREVDPFLEGKTEGRNAPNFLHGSVAGKAGSVPPVPTDVGPVVTQPGWCPVCPVPWDFGIWDTAL